MITVAVCTFTKPVAPVQPGPEPRRRRAGTGSDGYPSTARHED